MHITDMIIGSHDPGCGKTTWVPADATIAPAAPTPAPASDGQNGSAAALYTNSSGLSPPYPTGLNTTNSTAATAASPTSSNNTSSDRGTVMVACLKNGTLQLTLSDSILLDAHGRTGYIASNFQFQFDNPPQSEALFTSGWGACDDGTLSLGGAKRFWRCRSGGFYNLYDRWWAAQCSEVEIRVVKLVDCGT